MALIDELAGRVPKSIVRDPVTARVVRSDETGVYVSPLGGDLRHPIGPVRGPGLLDVGDIVLLVFTQERPWVLGVELTTQHELDTTNVHGIVDTADLETQEGAQEKVAAHSDETTDVHGIPDTADLETQIGAQDKADAAQDAAQLASVPRTWDTGHRRIVNAGDVTDTEDLRVWVRRTWSTVTVTVTETEPGTIAGSVTLTTLPAGFRPAKTDALAPVWDADAGSTAGHLRANTDGTLQLTAAVSGGLHRSTLVFSTADAMPDPLPGTAD